MRISDQDGSSRPLLASRALPVIRLLSLLVVVGMYGCGSAGTPANGIGLSVSPERLDPGDWITLTLTNESGERIGYNLCPSSLRRQDGGDWVLIESDRICTMELRTLEPGGSDSLRIELQNDLQPGTYRFDAQVVQLETDTQRSVSTESFIVS